MGVAWIKRDCFRDLELIMIVFFCCLQLMPARALRILIRDDRDLGDDRVNLGREDVMCVESNYQYVGSPYRFSDHENS